MHGDVFSMIFPSECHLIRLCTRCSPLGHAIILFLIRYVLLAIMKNTTVLKGRVHNYQLSPLSSTDPRVSNLIGDLV